jgi:hypothetical protein
VFPEAIKYFNKTPFSNKATFVSNLLTGKKS